MQLFPMVTAIATSNQPGQASRRHWFLCASTRSNDAYKSVQAEPSFCDAALQLAYVRTPVESNNTGRITSIFLWSATDADTAGSTLVTCALRRYIAHFSSWPRSQLKRCLCTRMV